MENVIDTHIHVWDLDGVDYPWLKGNTTILSRTYELEELDPLRRAAGITAGILVQAANSLEETAWMMKVAKRHPWIRGIVGWLPLQDPDATARLLESEYRPAAGSSAGAHPAVGNSTVGNSAGAHPAAGNPGAAHPMVGGSTGTHPAVGSPAAGHPAARQTSTLLKGVRHLIHDEADPRWLLQDTVLESLGLLAAYDVPYDLVGVLPVHIDTALKVAEKCPNLRMIFDHLNQPPISQKDKRWEELMKKAATHRNFYVKISGLGTAAGRGTEWTTADLEPCSEFAVHHFGADRCCCGGDWPVCLLAGSYEKTWKAYRTVIAKYLDPSEQSNVLYRNAEQFYRLAPAGQ